MFARASHGRADDPAADEPRPEAARYGGRIESDVAPVGSTRWWLAVAAGATAVTVFFGAQTLVGAAVRGQPLTWARTLGSELYYWYLLAVFLPGVLWLARRVRIRRGDALKTATLHSTAAVVIGAVHSVVYYAPLAVVLGASEPVAGVVRQIPTATMTVFWKYWVVIGVYYAFDYHRKYRERQEHAATLERSLVEARLEALRMQLHPHFLFNTLHTVSMLNLEDPGTANRVVSRLSEMLRMALDAHAEQEVPLAHEVEFVRRYLEVEGIRFEERLRTEVAVPPELLDACVPNLVLQPLVENAVRHGLASRREPGRIEVIARREGDRLLLEVSDDGPGIDGGAGRVAGRGMGLENTRARLSALYGSAGRMRLETSRAGGLRAVVELPYHTEPRQDGETGRAEPLPEGTPSR